jgi:hypothetical protein
MKTKFLWKALKKGIVSDKNDFKWKVGKWYHQDGKIKCYENGFHASTRVIDAMRFVDCEVLAKVEVKGDNDIESDRQAWSDMRIVKTYKWSKKDSVRLAIFAAEQVINIFEKKQPKNKRPREAIEAAKKWLKNPTEKNRLAAAAHHASVASSSGSYASVAAAYAAAASSVASQYASYYASYASYAAASSAASARERTLNKCEKFIHKEILKGKI